MRPGVGKENGVFECRQGVKAAGILRRVLGNKEVGQRGAKWRRGNAQIMRILGRVGRWWATAGDMGRDHTGVTAGPAPAVADVSRRGEWSGADRGLALPGTRTVAMRALPDGGAALMGASRTAASSGGGASARARRPRCSVGSGDGRGGGGRCASDGACMCVCVGGGDWADRRPDQRARCRQQRNKGWALCRR